MKTIFVLILIFIFYACNPQNIRRERGEPVTAAQPDSFLYYQPVPLQNSFLDSMDTKYDQEVSLKVRLVPPLPPPPSEFKQIEGYRIQLFAGLDSLNGMAASMQLKQSQQDSVYFFKENNLFSVQK